MDSLCLQEVSNFKLGLNHPLGVWRQVAVDEDKIPCKEKNGAPSAFAVAKGDLLYANFSKALTADDVRVHLGSFLLAR